MATSKIKSVAKTEQTWQGQSGTMYDYVVTMEDGTTGTASSTSPEAPPYGEGDEVEFTVSENKFGTKLRIKKASTFSGGGGFKQDPSTQKRIENSWALQTAVQIIGNCPEEQSYEDYIEGAALIAKLLLYKRDNLN